LGADPKNIPDEILVPIIEQIQKHFLKLITGSKIDSKENQD